MQGKWEIYIQNIYLVSQRVFLKPSQIPGNISNWFQNLLKNFHQSSFAKMYIRDWIEKIDF